MLEADNFPNSSPAHRGKDHIGGRGDDAGNVVEIDGIVYAFPNARMADEVIQALVAFSDLIGKLNTATRELNALNQRSRFRLVETRRPRPVHLSS